jgi:hypothetical protein
MADQKLTALTAVTDIADTDLLYVVDGVGGTPASKKITGANLKTTVAPPAGTYAPAASSGARLYQSTGQSIANNAWVTLLFDSEAEDTDDYHSTVTNTERLTVPSAGVYLVQANMRMAGNTGDRAIRVRLNGTVVRTNLARSGANYEGGAVATIRLKMTAGQYVDAQCLHTQGSTTATVAGASETSFEITRLGN